MDNLNKLFLAEERFIVEKKRETETGSHHLTESEKLILLQMHQNFVSLLTIPSVL